MIYVDLQQKLHTCAEAETELAHLNVSRRPVVECTVVCFRPVRQGLVAKNHQVPLKVASFLVGTTTLSLSLQALFSALNACIGMNRWLVVHPQWCQRRLNALTAKVASHRY